MPSKQMKYYEKSSAEAKSKFSSDSSGYGGSPTPFSTSSMERREYHSKDSSRNTSPMPPFSPKEGKNVSSYQTYEYNKRTASPSGGIPTVGQNVNELDSLLEDLNRSQKTSLTSNNISRIGERETIHHESSRHGENKYGIVNSTTVEKSEKRKVPGSPLLFTGDRPSRPREVHQKEYYQHEKTVKTTPSPSPVPKFYNSTSSLRHLASTPPPIDSADTQMIQKYELENEATPQPGTRVTTKEYKFHETSQRKFINGVEVPIDTNTPPHTSDYKYSESLERSKLPEIRSPSPSGRETKSCKLSEITQQNTRYNSRPISPEPTTTRTYHHSEINQHNQSTVNRSKFIPPEPVITKSYEEINEHNTTYYPPKPVSPEPTSTRSYHHSELSQRNTTNYVPKPVSPEPTTTRMYHHSEVNERNTTNYAPKPVSPEPTTTKTYHLSEINQHNTTYYPPPPPTITKTYHFSEVNQQKTTYYPPPPPEPYVTENYKYEKLNQQNTTYAPQIQQPPKQLDELMSSFTDTKYAEHKTVKKDMVDHSVMTEPEKTKPIAGPPVYYPPIQEVKKEDSYYMEKRQEGKGEMHASREANYKYEAGGKMTEYGKVKKTWVPCCCPLCCALPCVIM